MLHTGPLRFFFIIIIMNSFLFVWSSSTLCPSRLVTTSTERASLWLLLFTPLSHVTARQQSSGKRGGAKCASQGAKGPMFAWHAECLVKWERVGYCWTLRRNWNPKYRSLHAHIDLTSIPLPISLLAISGLIRPPPTWEHGEYGSEGVELEAVDDVAKVTHLNGHEDASGGQQKDVQALRDDAQPQHSCGEKVFFFMIDQLQRRRRRRRGKKNMHMYRSSEWRRREIRGWGLRTPQRKGKDSG